MVNFELIDNKNMIISLCKKHHLAKHWYNAEPRNTYKIVKDNYIVGIINFDIIDGTLCINDKKIFYKWDEYDKDISISLFVKFSVNSIRSHKFGYIPPKAL